ncbi:MFS transporter [Acidiphilium sp. PA]|uniref:MFS transporter n=1 Tax=Acidiphilium sp. PA TaxID=2871705 RepID=UPI002242CAA0|nr:MFS transporter [Acidiphilium sp. PA]MCW8309218.1 MFS transporter [Acidiphilium sp. PA]
MTPATGTHPRGIGRNRGQFALQAVQVFFVGLMIGMERAVLPTLSGKFGVKPHAFFFLASFVLSFGLVKGALNFVAGALSDRIGRKPVLLIGWLAAVPIPLMIYIAPTWWWIIGANVFLGINQGLTWTMTVTSQIDLAGTNQRGLAVGINEATGYVAVGIAGLAAAYLAAAFGARAALLGFGLVTIALGLGLLIKLRDTLPWVRAESAEALAAKPAGTAATPPPGWGSVFMLVSFRDRQYRALCQGGIANKIADTLVWALFPIFFHLQGLKLAEIGWITGLYAMVWGVSQLWTGDLADRIGRKPPIVTGFLLLAGGIAMTALGTVPMVWFIAAAIMGLAMALLYPNLIAAMSDLTPPLWRGKALGTYRYWRDTGYAIGALLLGLVAQAAGRGSPGNVADGTARRLLRPVDRVRGQGAETQGRASVTLRQPVRSRRWSAVMAYWGSPHALRSPASRSVSIIFSCLPKILSQFEQAIRHRRSLNDGVA